MNGDSKGIGHHRLAKEIYRKNLRNSKKSICFHNPGMQFRMVVIVSCNPEQKGAGVFLRRLYENRTRIGLPGLGIFQEGFMFGPGDRVFLELFPDHLDAFSQLGIPAPGHFQGI